MAYKSNKRRFVSLAALFLTLVTIETALAVDCGGKPFHCDNSTHFKICVDFGNGVSSTMDDFVIQCPPGTECRDTNHYECEFLKPTTLAPPVRSDDTNDKIEERSPKNASPLIEVVNTVSSDQHVTEHSEKILNTDSQFNTNENSAGNSSGVTETDTTAFSYAVTMKPLMDQTTSAYDNDGDPYKLITTTATTASDLTMVTTSRPELFNKVTTEGPRSEPDEKVITSAVSSTTESENIVPMVTKSLVKVSVQPIITETVSHKQETSVSEDVQESSFSSSETPHSTDETSLSSTVSEILPYTTNPYVTNSMSTVYDSTAVQAASPENTFDKNNNHESNHNLNLANQNVDHTKSSELPVETTTRDVKTFSHDTLPSNILETEVPNTNEYTLVTTTKPTNNGEELSTKGITVSQKIDNGNNSTSKFLIIVPEIMDTQSNQTNKTTLDEYFDSNYSGKGNINEAVDYISSLLHDSNFSMTEIQDELNVTTADQLNLPDLDKISLLLSKSERANENATVQDYTESSLTSSNLTKHEKSMTEHENKYSETVSDDYLQNDKQVENSTTTTFETLSSESEIIDQNTKDINTQLGSFILAMTETSEIHEPQQNNLNTTETIKDKSITGLFNSVRNIHDDSIKINDTTSTEPSSGSNATKPLTAYESINSNKTETMLINSFMPVTQNVNTYLLGGETIGDSNFTLYITNYTQNPDTESIIQSETTNDAILRVKPLEKNTVNPQQYPTQEESTVKSINYEINPSKILSDNKNSLKSTTESAQILNVTEKDMVVINDADSIMSPNNLNLDKKRDVKTTSKDENEFFNAVSISKVANLTKGLNIEIKSADNVELTQNKASNGTVSATNTNKNKIGNDSVSYIPINGQQKMAETEPYLNSEANEKTQVLTTGENFAVSRSSISDTDMNGSVVENNISQNSTANNNASNSVVTTPLPMITNININTENTKLTSTEPSLVENVDASSTMINVGAIKNDTDINMNASDTIITTTTSTTHQIGNNSGFNILNTTQTNTESAVISVNYSEQNKTEDISTNSPVTTNAVIGATERNGQVTVSMTTKNSEAIYSDNSSNSENSTKLKNSAGIHSEITETNLSVLDVVTAVPIGSMLPATTVSSPVTIDNESGRISVIIGENSQVNTKIIESNAPNTAKSTIVRLPDTVSKREDIMKEVNTINKEILSADKPVLGVVNTVPSSTTSQVPYSIDRSQKSDNGMNITSTQHPKTASSSNNVASVLGLIGTPTKEIKITNENVKAGKTTPFISKTTLSADEQILGVTNTVLISTTSQKPYGIDNSVKGDGGINSASTQELKAVSVASVVASNNTPNTTKINQSNENVKAVNTTPLNKETLANENAIYEVVTIPSLGSTISHSPAVNNNKPDSSAATTINNVVKKVTEPTFAPTRTESLITNGVYTTPMSTQITKSSQNAPKVVITVSITTESPVPITKVSTLTNVNTLKIVNTIPIKSDIEITKEPNLQGVTDTVTTVTKEPITIGTNKPLAPSTTKEYTTPISVQSRVFNQNTPTIRTNKTNEIKTVNTELNLNGSGPVTTLIDRDRLQTNVNITEKQITSEYAQGKVVTVLLRTNSSVPNSTKQPIVNRKIVTTNRMSTEVPVTSENAPGLPKTIPIKTTRPLPNSTQRPITDYTIPMSSNSPTKVVKNTEQANRPTSATTQTIAMKTKINISNKPLITPTTPQIMLKNKTNSFENVTKTHTTTKKINGTGLNTGHGIYHTPIQTKSNPVNKDINTSLTLVTSKSFNCTKAGRGRFADKHDCRKFYICVDKHAIVGTCPVHTVFSDIKKQCTKNLSHCIRNNEFKCIKPGRYSDMTAKNIYYICVKNGPAFIRFKFQCQQGFHLNKETVKCIHNEQPSPNQSTSSLESSKNRSESDSDGGKKKKENESEKESSKKRSDSESDSSKKRRQSELESSRKRSDSDSDSSKKSGDSESDSSKKRSDSDSDSSRKRSESDASSSSDDKKSKERKRSDSVCTEEGKIPHPDNCRKYYVCYKTKKSELRKRRRKCDSDEVFHKDKKKCVDADSYECQD
ncbi:mucin-5AC-like [Plutella xylostella]|uniref:mucin-5AC-like n=1 Tax=Plutella xylostella TaxID=51655 RepID=UPI00203260CB|nr:mucin-5AC-like [Plutella xylostella]